MPQSICIAAILWPQVDDAIGTWPLMDGSGLMICGVWVGVRTFSVPISTGYHPNVFPGTRC